MELGKILLKKKIVTQEQIDQALAHQKEFGGRLGDCLVAMGFLEQDHLKGVMTDPPKAPQTPEDSGIPVGELRNLLLKIMATMELQSPGQIADVMKLPRPVVKTLIDEGVEHRIIETLGAAGDGAMMGDLRFTLTTQGKERAAKALEHNTYIGAAPVSLETYTDQIQKQKITNERVNPRQVESAFDNLVIAQQFMDNIGPAINSGRSILLYGPPGNGKTTIAERIAHIFSNVVYIPYCVQVDGQIIKVYDPAVHVEVAREEENTGKSIRRDSVDRRWVPCERPIVITGGELNMEMLDLKYNPQARFYEAPLHIKALGGTFIIDDFGRQLVSPEEILNRWIVPLQSRVDFLKLHTGKSFEIPFDELIIFSTNLQPKDLMDPAFLRRIPFKLETIGPNVDQFRDIFAAIAGKSGLEVPDEVFDYVVAELEQRTGGELACYQPAFIIDQVLCACKYTSSPPVMERSLVERAIGNLFADPTHKPAEDPAEASVQDQQKALADAAGSEATANAA